MINLKEAIQPHYIDSIGPLDLPIRQFSLHSAVPNDDGVFFCRSGRLNSLDFIEEAVENGAICVIATEKELLQKYSDFPHITFIVVQDLSAVMTTLLQKVYQEAYEDMEFYGVTGTNGKTTVTYLVSSLLNRLGFKTGSVGTEGVMTHELRHRDYHKTTPTTPEAPELARIIHTFKEEEYQSMVFEATSIALDQKRTAFFPVNVGIFTNFSKDHMDYHKTIDHYLQSKMKLAEAAETLIYSLDEPAFRGLAEKGKPTVTFSLRHPEADLYGENIVYDESGSRFHLYADGRVYDVYTPFVGEHNIYNVMSACAVLYSKGVDMERIVEEVFSIPPLRNRFQIVTICDRRFILDFAHTPVALEQTLDAARTLTDGKLIAMVNGIGLRGLEKAKHMTQKIGPDIDEIVLGAEQVGYTEPGDVLTAMKEALSPMISSKKVTTAPSRKAAIYECIDKSLPGDTILLTGINEPQHYKGTLIPHDDLEEIRNYFNLSCCDLKKTM
ncbi:Mur ligase family protein [Salimicrobium halophilum]|uniref:UDP-N-acetylmuramoylalanyl-D-glutamate--2,6-diaminopimelate ligase n=1 Tax=Salimicrobium halophilum TaxID=86666 RepID=A0A1G8T5J6_9BACI|nr:UDP-N-acetylmuramyl-tripeptide synthetase [Salimicrobium halophilum]SDJ36776.1 UDP-N-acetylmuramoylalanyl-D-glutamate--2,6-diaminopimelate ligase [Salimicrobium halophilum]